MADGAAFRGDLAPICDAPSGMSQATSSSSSAAPGTTATLVAYHDDFDKHNIIERPFLESLVPSQPKHSEEPQAKKQKVGLSPKMLGLNKRLKTAKFAKGRPLTKEELATLRSEFQTFWQSLPNHDAFVLAYQDWRDTAPEGQDEIVAEFEARWGGGCFCSPVSSTELYQYHAHFGWPSDAEVHDTMDGECKAPTDDDTEFGASSAFRLWSVAASPRNVPRARAQSPRQFDIVEKGLVGVLEGLGRPRADAGVSLFGGADKSCDHTPVVDTCQGVFAHLPVMDLSSALARHVYIVLGLSLAKQAVP